MSDSLDAAHTRAGFGQSRPLAGPNLVHRAATAFRVALGIFIFFLILEFVTSLELVPPIYLPRASTVIRRMVELLQDPQISQACHGNALCLGSRPRPRDADQRADRHSYRNIRTGLQNEFATDRIHAADSLGGPDPAWNFVVGTRVPHESHPGGLCHHVADLVQHRLRRPRRRSYRGSDRPLLWPEASRYPAAYQSSERSAFHLHRNSHLRIDRIDRRNRRRVARIRRQRHRLVHSVCVVQRRPDGLSSGRRGDRRNRWRDDQQCSGLDRSSLLCMAIPGRSSTHEHRRNKSSSPRITRCSAPFSRSRFDTAWASRS